MPPKKALKTNGLVEETTDIAKNSEKDVVDIATLQRDLTALFDRRFKEQTDHINNLFRKLSKSTKSDLDEIRKSQELLGTKFDELAVSINEVKTENAKLKKDNAKLQQRVSLLQKQDDVAITLNYISCLPYSTFFEAVRKINPFQPLIRHTKTKKQERKLLAIWRIRCQWITMKKRTRRTK